MSDFDPEQFEDKYANYFPELQRAYKQAFETMNDRYDSELIHAIDQQILSESEPFYEESPQRSADDSSGPRGGEAASNGTSAEQSSASSRTGEARETTAEPSPSPREHDGEFRIELPEDPTDRLSGVPTADDEKVETILDRYVEEIEAELRSVFGLDG